MNKFYTLLSVAALGATMTATAAEVSNPVNAVRDALKLHTDLIVKLTPEQNAVAKAMFERNLAAKPQRVAPETGWSTEAINATYRADLLADLISNFSAGDEWAVEMYTNTENEGWYQTIVFNENNPVVDLVGPDENSIMSIKADDTEAVLMEDFVAYDEFVFIQQTPDTEFGAILIEILEYNEVDATPLYGTFADNIMSWPTGSVWYYNPEEGTVSRVNREGLFGFALDGAEFPAIWEDLGEGSFLDGIMSPMFSNTKYEAAPVTVLRNIENPNFYRVLNAWYATFNMEIGGNLDIYTDDPACVAVPMQSTGIATQEDGLTYILSCSENFESVEAFLASEYADRAITLDENNRVNFPENACYFYWPETDPERIYTVRDPKTGYLDIPTSAINAIGADSNVNAPVEYFNLQGVRVAADNLGTGIYVRRQGSESTKVLVK